MKTDKINNIERIINQWGGFDIKDIGHQPIVLNSNESIISLYDYDVITNNDNVIEYNQFNDQIIDEIEMIAQDYEVDCLKTEKRIS